ncbi:2-deoxy-scyllo-inosamine dehydrogenase [Cryobacterium frigoriphilum]|uniref:2-deoxy-scyllo-inosamine dehydrogenase n=2 Tax=Cryobacterium frigoriphilum TaxID=1259150 RepID=A0A4R9A9K8_9MICO|nr:2-deoxy-scyllo-inosamine dehydrogenase [Cryobacterium frigoriphilum]
MLAACTVSRETIEYQQLAEPAIAAAHALVRVHHVTLCGTDLHIWEDDYATELPIVQGHEFVGIIEGLPVGAPEGWAIGDRVAVSPVFSCGTCYACSIGRTNACADISVYGCYEDGALVELINVPFDKLHLVPADLPLHIASLWEPMSIAMQAVNRSHPVRGEKAVVLGCGPIGLLVTLYLTDLGVDVLAADTLTGRTDFARQFGAQQTMLVDPARDFPTAEQTPTLDTFTRGQGPSLVFEATGMPSSLGNALRMVATAGRVVAVGISDREVALSMRTVPVKEIDLIGSRNSLNLVDASLEILSRHPEQAAALVTHRFPFEDLGTAFETMRSRTELVGKVAIDMPGARA